MTSAKIQLLYREGNDYVFMDNQSYDQLNVSAATLGDAVNYLVDNSTVMLMMYRDEIVGYGGLGRTDHRRDRTGEGDRVLGAKKPATLETGLVIQVPLFISPGERVEVDTRSGEFLSRA